jgi:HEAT repeat protein
MPPMPPAVWMPEHYFPDTDVRIQALGSLIRTDAPKVIPILRTIVLESHNPGEARRALFVLAQSGRPDARSTVVEVAKTGPETVKLAAVRELGRLSGPTVSNELLQVYFTGNQKVKYQVVRSLGQRDATTALLQIAQAETDRPLRDSAIVTLGEAGGRDELRMLYSKAAADAKRPIIVGLFNAQAVEALINIAERERDPAVRQEVLSRLRLIGTPRALTYLAGLKQK